MVLIRLERAVWLPISFLTLVAEHAAPALVADAFEGLLAGAVVAPGVGLALGAKGALPSLTTPEKEKTERTCISTFSMELKKK